MLAPDETAPPEYNPKNNLNYYQNWPIIRSISENIVLIGGSKSNSGAGGKSESVSKNGSSVSTNNSFSSDVNTSVNSITLPNALYDELTINIVPIGTLGSIPVPYSVNPSVLSATNPKQFPTGNYLITSEIQPYKFGYSKITAITVEITTSHVT